MILDCFTFFNELDLLEIRLHTLSPYVDYFVISESNCTFQGQPKPFYFHENRSRFSDFESKIIWVPVRIGGHRWTPWEREANQRRAIRRELLSRHIGGNLKLENDDIILLSDVDEIPDLECPGKLPWQEGLNRRPGGVCMPVIWIHDMTYYWVDLYASRWRGTIAMKLGDLDQLLNGDMQKMRDCRGVNGHFVQPGGWHFSFLGGVDAIQTKIKAFSHTEYLSSADRGNISDAVGERWKSGVDLFGRDIYKFRPLAAEERERLPGYLVANRSRFAGLFRPTGSDDGTGQRHEDGVRCTPAETQAKS